MRKLVYYRKIILLFIALGLTTLAACGVSDGEPRQQPTAEPPSIASEAEHSPATAQASPEAYTPAETPSALQPEQTIPKEMTAGSSGIIEGVITDKFGMYGEQLSNGIPTLSIPIDIMDAPEGTKCYAIEMLDPDSKPLCGYEWVHWLAVNIAVAELPENSSIDMAAEMVQGENDFGFTGYGGPTPPDKPHTYIVTIYALDAEADLQDGFSKDQFDGAIKEHILAQTQIMGSYRN